MTLSSLEHFLEAKASTPRFQAGGCLEDPSWLKEDLFERILFMGFL